MGPQPTGSIGQPSGGGLGAAVLPQGLGDPAVDEQARTLGLADGFQRYLKRSGRSQDPLLEAVRSRETRRGTMVDEQTPARLLGSPEQPFRVNTTGNERKGLSFQQFELPGGQRVNVYYGKNGQRTVVRLPKRRK